MRSELAGSTRLRVLGGTEDWWRVRLEDGRSGFLFDLGDAACLLEAVERCCGRGGGAVRAKVSRAAVRRIDEDFSIQAVARSYADLYRTMVS